MINDAQAKINFVYLIFLPCSVAILDLWPCLLDSWEPVRSVTVHCLTHALRLFDLLIFLLLFFKLNNFLASSLAV